MKIQLNESNINLARNMLSAAQVRRCSKCVFEIAGEKFDVRKWKGFNFGPTRRALNMWLAAQLPQLAAYEIDHAVCEWINARTVQVQTIEWQTVL